MEPQMWQFRLALRTLTSSRRTPPSLPSRTFTANRMQCLHCRTNASAAQSLRSWRADRDAVARRSPPSRRWRTNPADLPGFVSIVDKPAPKVKLAGKKHGWGLIVLAAIPITSFLLGCWQVKRLQWKTALVARLEDNLARPPLPLPPHIDPDEVNSFDYRRVWTKGTWDHDKEILIGPRIRDGENGFFVVTPLRRHVSDTPDGLRSQESTRQSWTAWATSFFSTSTTSSPTPDDGPGAASPGERQADSILVTRGWIAKDLFEQRSRQQEADALPLGSVVVEGLLRQPYRRNMFTPDNRPAEGAWFFPDVEEMAKWAGTSPVWMEETMVPSTIEAYRRTTHGIPLGREAVVDVRNNHLQYIATWFSLSLATTFMFYLLVKKPPGDAAMKVRLSRRG